MAEARQGYDEDRLPWLEAVDDEDAPRAISGGKMAAFIVVVLVAMGLVAATMFWLGQTNQSIGGAPELIAAPDTPIKVKPDDPGGLDVAGDSETAFATSAGEETDARLDTTKMAEAPVIAVREPEPAPAPAPAPREAPAPDAPPAVTPPAPAGPQIQLGAYGTRAKAETGWVLLSSNFPEVAGLKKNIVQARVNGQTVYRLRAVAPDRNAASAACTALTAAGENCFPVRD
ncbi:SPOR domain-containing protein [Sphingomicrobium flavum]|uniref:SPOR domain-containing protein n=1 Tax=Sphingomicrobium flavum TaxID=1229164 RepID=UPI0021AD7216|nr:SPOR domain-containing protein [Sphingomicrobium flavum]